MISAAEASSDLHGAELIKKLKPLVLPNEDLKIYGIGGPELQKEGLVSLVESRELLSMGFLEIISRLPKILYALKKVTQAAKDERPDVALVIDYPGLHFRLAQRFKNLGIPVVYYIPPKVWVRRKERVKFLKNYIDRVISIFPFEQEFFRNEGLEISYVGNPLLDELPMQLSREEARRKLGIGQEETVIAVLPGSRPAELKHHLFLFLEAADRAARKMKENSSLNKSIRVVMPLARTTDDEKIRAQVNSWLKKNESLVQVTVLKGQSAEAMKAADAGLIKSGTSTLEAALLGCPHAIIFKPSPVSCFLYRLFIKYSGPIGLANLIEQGLGNPRNGNHAIREYVCEQVTVENLEKETIQLLTDLKYRTHLKNIFEIVKGKLLVNESPSLAAAKELLAVSRNASRSVG